MYYKLYRFENEKNELKHVNLGFNYAWINQNVHKTFF